MTEQEKEVETARLMQVLRLREQLRPGRLHVDPRAHGDLPQVLHAPQNLQLVVQRLAATVVGEPEPLHHRPLVLEAEFLVHGG